MRTQEATDLPINLLTPLVERAAASRHLSGLDFVDRAAERLVQEFKISNHDFDLAIKKLKRNCHSMLACKWIDEQLSLFFDEHANGCAIEIGAGLSTRFHRVSSRHDWPRFRWFSFDEEKVTDLVRHFMPETDNYSSVNDDVDCSGLDRLLYQAQQQASLQSPLIVVFEPGQDINEVDRCLLWCKKILESGRHLHFIVSLDKTELCNVQANLKPYQLRIRQLYRQSEMHHSFFSRSFLKGSYVGIGTKTIWHLSTGSVSGEGEQ